MTDFKQIIGRGTRVREDYGKLFFNIIDYTGSATRLFADPDFDGEPALIDEELIDEEGEVVEQTVVEDENQGGEDGRRSRSCSLSSPRTSLPSTASTTSMAVTWRSLHRSSTSWMPRATASSRQLHGLRPRQGASAVSLTRSNSTSDWATGEQRQHILDALAERGIDLHRLGEVAGVPEADPLDLLCHLAFNGPLEHGVSGLTS